MIGNVYPQDDVKYYYKALMRFPHVDDENQECRWPIWTTMHYKGFNSKRKNTEAWKSLIELLEQENLITIDKKKRVKRLYK